MNRPEITPCTGCEMRSSCIRDHRCYRPQTLEHAIRVYKSATEAFVAATENLQVAGKEVLAAMKRETV